MKESDNPADFARQDDMNPMVSRLKNFSFIKILSHGLVWVFLLLFPLPFFMISSDYFLRAILQSLLLASLFYFNLYWLIPRYLYTKMVLTYFSALLLSTLLIILFSTASEFMFELGDMQMSSFSQGLQPLASLPGPLIPVLIPIILKTLLIVAISISFALLSDYFERDRQQKELENKKLNSELNMLKLQINPHFFFNTLNSVYFLARQKSDRTPEAIIKLSELMRYIIYDSAKQKVPLSQELQYIRNFIEIQKLRLNEKNQVHYTESGSFDKVAIEPLLVLPFIENAFKHGVSTEVKTDIDIRLELVQNKLLVRVGNQLLPNPYDKNQGGIGLENSRKRLNLLYPGRHELDIIEKNGRYEVSLTIILNPHELLNT